MATAGYSKLYDALRGPLAWMANNLYSLDVEGEENVPGDGPWVGAVHPHNGAGVELFLLVGALPSLNGDPRQAAGVAKPSLEGILSLSGLPHFIVYRDKDEGIYGLTPEERAELNEESFFIPAKERLEEGGIVLGHPQGQRNKGRAHTGLARLAESAGCPLVPILVQYDRDPWDVRALLEEGGRKPNLYVCAGKPLYVADAAEATGALSDFYTANRKEFV